MENQKIDVTIHNKKLALSSDLGAEHILKICETVNEKIEQLTSNTSLNTNEKLYLFASISLCDELLRYSNNVLEIHKDYYETNMKYGLDKKQLQEECKTLKTENLELLEELENIKSSLKDKAYIAESMKNQFNTVYAKQVTIEGQLQEKELEVKQLEDEIESLKTTISEITIENSSKEDEKENSVDNNEKEELVKKLEEQDKYILELQVSIQNQEDTILELLYEKESLMAQLEEKEK